VAPARVTFPHAGPRDEARGSVVSELDLPHLWPARKDEFGEPLPVVPVFDPYTHLSPPDLGFRFPALRHDASHARCDSPKVRNQALKIQPHPSWSRQSVPEAGSFASTTMTFGCCSCQGSASYVADSMPQARVTFLHDGPRHSNLTRAQHRRRPSCRATQRPGRGATVGSVATRSEVRCRFEWRRTAAPARRLL
jgi:hypothetical protein